MLIKVPSMYEFCFYYLNHQSNTSLEETRSKTPIEYIRALQNILQKWTAGVSPNPKSSSDAFRYIYNIKSITAADDAEFTNDQITEFVNEAKRLDLIPLLVLHLEKFDTEARKNAAKIFTFLVRRQEGNFYPTRNYLEQKREIIFALFHNYENSTTALTCGSMLRECLRYESLTEILLYSENFYSFFDYIDMVNFDVASDAFASFREILSRHKELIARFLTQNYEKFFDRFAKTLENSNYATKRLSIKLLGDILLDRANFKVMTIYISKKGNLKQIMNLLKNKSRNIQLETFHVFKIFVANPKKAPQIAEILHKNKDKMIMFLEDFHNAKNNDRRFFEEKDYVIKQIKAL